MDNSDVQSRTGLSSVESSQHVLNFPETTLESTNQQEFVNHGLTVWNQTRHQWVSNERSRTQSQIRESRISDNATYRNLLGNYEPFPKPISLFEMVEFLVGIWEDLGWYEILEGNSE